MRNRAHRASDEVNATVASARLVPSASRTVARLAHRFLGLQVIEVETMG